MSESYENLLQPIHVTVRKESTLRLGTLELACVLAYDPEGTVLRLLSQEQVADVFALASTATFVHELFTSGHAEHAVSDEALTYAQVYTWNPAPGQDTAPTGYRAELLPELCHFFRSAREAGALEPRQEPLAEHCAHMLLAFAKVGIVALVDEATGYQKERERGALHRLLARFLGDAPLQRGKETLQDRMERYLRDLPSDWSRLAQPPSFETRPSKEQHT
jgi:hypothetical protein